MRMTVYVAAGSNVEPEKNLARALDELEQAFGALAISPAYRNPAVGFAGEDFINLVVGFRTADTSRAGEASSCERIEASCGRPRDAPKWAPRTMDLDILLYGELVSDEPGLMLPRPDLLRRAYMLGPLADSRRSCVHPTQTPHDRRAVGGNSRRRITSFVAVTSPRSGRRRPPGSGR